MNANRALNRGGWRARLRRIQDSSLRFDLSDYEAPLAAIAELERELRGIPDDEIRRRGQALHARARAGEPLDDMRVPTFALAREAARRILGERPFDEQVVAGLALHDGHVVEMQTGEGKTLAAVLPATLNAYADRGIHVLTFNDYLARRDAEWMGPVYRLLGVSVSFVQEGMPPGRRRTAYGADVTYVTAKEAGFDHLRDLLVLDRAELVHRPLHFALVDEADSLMVDEARVPLVIAGRMDREDQGAPHLAALVASLSPGVHFDTDEHRRSVELTEAGVEYLEERLGCGHLHSQDNLALLTGLHCALHARVLLRRDVDYIVRGGRIEMVDDFTGRVAVDRHWPDGLHAAIEAKEGLEVGRHGRVLGSMTLQRFLRGYRRLCGMTGTARDAADELRQVYGLDVVVVPTHRPMIRIDRPDVVFSRSDAKDRAVVDEIRRAQAAGRPVLVGTSSVTESERLTGLLRESGLSAVVLNARNDAEEAAIVARAGSPGAVTISTNMAGRGTDIRLGGERESERDRVVPLGGLYVIGTNRHESRRVDYQLRGRAGRQGDPGESRFFVSLEDDLFARFGLHDAMPRFIRESDGLLENPIVAREIARAQRILEGQNFEIRQTLDRYARIVDDQQHHIQAWRRAILTGEEQPRIWLRSAGERASLVAAAGEQAVAEAERVVTLSCIDLAWQDHLAFCADLREGIHLVRLGNQDPLTEFAKAAIHAFARIRDEIEADVLARLAKIRTVDSRIDLASAGVSRPGATWTYLVNDDPFKNRIGALLTGPGRTTVAIYAAAIVTPLLILWGVVDRFVRRRNPPSSK